MAVSWIGATPSNAHMHYNSFVEDIGGQPLSMVAAIENGDYDRYHIHIADDPHNNPIIYNCYVTDDPEDALAKAHKAGEQRVPMDLMTVRGQFVLFAQKKFKATFFENKKQWVDVQHLWRQFVWHWYPSSEKLGYILKPVHVRPYDQTVEIEGIQHNINDFIAEFYKEINRLFLPEQEIQNLFA